MPYSELLDCPRCHGSGCISCGARGTVPGPAQDPEKEACHACLGSGRTVDGLSEGTRCPSCGGEGWTRKKKLARAAEPDTAGAGATRGAGRVQKKEASVASRRRKVAVTTHREVVEFTVSYTRDQVADILRDHSSERISGSLASQALVPGAMLEPVNLVAGVSVDVNPLHDVDDYGDRVYVGHRVTVVVPVELVREPPEEKRS